MSADPVVAYQEHLTHLQKAETTASDLVKFIEDACQKLHHWRNVILSNCNTFSFSFKMAHYPKPGTINMELWPTVDQLGKALSDYLSQCVKCRKQRMEYDST